MATLDSQASSLSLSHDSSSRRTPIFHSKHRDKTIRSKVSIVYGEAPEELADGNKSIVEYKPGALARDVAVVICLALCPLGLCWLAPLMYYSKYCTRLKDAHHMDPSTGAEVGCYTHSYTHGVVRGKMEFTQSIESDSAVNGIVNKQPTTRTIVFGSKPVTLPDGHTTKTRHHIGQHAVDCSIIAFIILSVFTLCLCSPLALLCLVLPCCRDVEHTHPESGEIVGKYYRPVYRRRKY